MVDHEEILFRLSVEALDLHHGNLLRVGQREPPDIVRPVKDLQSATVVDDSIVTVALVALGAVVFGGWLWLELWVRLSPTVEVGFTEREVRGASEGSSYRVRVAVPTDDRVIERWLFTSHRRYETLEGRPTIPVHVRRLGGRTLVRGVGQWNLLLVVGLLAAILVVNLFMAVLDLIGFYR